RVRPARGARPRARRRALRARGRRRPGRRPRAPNPRGRDHERKERAMPLVLAAGVKALPLSIFAVVLAGTLGITYWASKRTSTATELWAARRSVHRPQHRSGV